MTLSLSGTGLSAIAVLTTAAFLSACSSSGSDSNTPANDQAGGQGTAMPAPGSDESPGSVAEPGSQPSSQPSSQPGSGSDSTPDPVSSPDGGGDTGESGGPVSVSGQATSLGLVQIDQDSMDPTGGTVFANFFQLQTQIPVSQFVSSVIPPLDTCTVFRNSDQEPVASVPEFDFVSLDAGDALVLSSPQGTWLTLLRMQQFGFTLYQPAVETLPLPVPVDLVLDIPGAQYPAYPGVRVPNVMPLTGVLAQGASDFSWQAGSGDPSVYIGIELFGLGSDNTFVSVSCTAADDGQFSIPADIQAQLGENFAPVPRLRRVGSRAEQRGDSVLLVTHSTAAQ